MNLKDCLARGYLVEESVDDELVQKEILESDYDFARAESALKEKDYKWIIIKCYYSMFHSAKSVCFKLGYREKKHIAVLIVLEELNKNGKLESDAVNMFRAAIDSREGADYRYNYSQNIAEQNLRMAQEFNKRMKNLLEKLNGDS